MACSWLSPDGRHFNFLTRGGNHRQSLQLQLPSLQPTTTTTIMRFSTLALGLVAFVATAQAACSNASAKPDSGDIALYNGKDCSGTYTNVGAMNTCKTGLDFKACSAITRKGVTCDIYKANKCSGAAITIDSAGYRGFCGTFKDTINSVRCRSA
ncbi:hypothetical protein BX616_008987 [Lobosporangium transversale]|uniref:Uncharacterized protein n=1 Tax=Lobosporangium transversale TaxID=64571 RepID=A0A1Y2GHB4_9FUNG|nr:hypothetical protein BCR41DRAFT_424782 [Lobosporangium transversale]KAF9914092.1 hypothetical protein BX616_008987 [Lobosporangium transversale]ORZ07523.1 hypothetical protein BCR41DRAFT_424782 [Lobosporangium transversale]|eukprot:XP_021878030.1 hypothetical protein BCR41DRAFT_424782 [Lobosporangium transversale]